MHRQKSIEIRGQERVLPTKSSLDLNSFDDFLKRYLIGLYLQYSTSRAIPSDSEGKSEKKIAVLGKNTQNHACHILLLYSFRDNRVKYEKNCTKMTNAPTMGRTPRTSRAYIMWYTEISVY